MFIDEQRVPRELEFDERDEACRHVVAFDGDLPVGTGRLDLDYGGKIGRGPREVFVFAPNAINFVDGRGCR